MNYLETIDELDVLLHQPVDFKAGHHAAEQPSAGGVAPDEIDSKPASSKYEGQTYFRVGQGARTVDRIRAIEV